MVDISAACMAEVIAGIKVEKAIITVAMIPAIARAISICFLCSFNHDKLFLPTTLIFCPNVMSEF